MQIRHRAMPYFEFLHYLSIFMKIDRPVKVSFPRSKLSGKNSVAQIVEMIGLPETVSVCSL